MTVRYEAVNAMLLNEFLKEHRKVEEQDGRVQAQEATIAELKSAVAKQQATGAQQKNDLEARIAQQRNDFQARVTQQQKQIEALTAGLQKVSNQVALQKPSPRTVANDQ